MCGRDVLRYGGNTTSVEIVSASGNRLLIDLGTGATELAKQLMGSEFGKGQGQLTVLLTHTHLDHIQGLPFFSPFFIKGNRIRIMGTDPADIHAMPGHHGISLEATLQNQLAPHYSPLGGLENLAAGVTIETFRPGASFEVDGFAVETCALPHGAMWTTGFRVTVDGKTLVMLTDVEYPSPDQPTDAALHLARGANLLIHDAMHADHDYDTRRGWGHSPVRAALTVAALAGVQRLALFHHSPDATDDVIDQVVASARAMVTIPVFAAAEGAYLEV